MKKKDLQLKRKRIFFWERNHELPREIEDLNDFELFLETGATNNKKNNYDNKEAFNLYVDNRHEGLI